MKFTTLPVTLPVWHPAAWIGTFLFSGLLPRAPGTWGTLAALPFAWLIASFTSPLWLLAAGGVLFLIGWWAAEIYEDHLDEHDAGEIVVDEAAAVWMLLAIVPLNVWLYIAAFIIFRGFDVLKPWPIKWVDQRVGRGFVIMIDDVVAALYGAPLVYGLVWLMESNS